MKIIFFQRYIVYAKVSKWLDTTLYQIGFKKHKDSPSWWCLCSLLLKMRLILGIKSFLMKVVIMFLIEKCDICIYFYSINFITLVSRKKDLFKLTLQIIRTNPEMENILSDKSLFHLQYCNSHIKKKTFDLVFMEMWEEILRTCKL